MSKTLKLTGDFETLIHPEYTRVWASCLVDIDTCETVQISNCIDETFDFLSRHNSIVYYHNEAFDGEFWVSYLLRKGFKALYDEPSEENSFRPLITDNGVWYCIEIYFKKKNKKWNKCTIYDSYKKLPFKVATIAKAFNLPMRKLKIDYEAFREEGHILTPEESEYLQIDAKIVAAALKIQFEQEMVRMTVGSDALNDLKSVMDKKVFQSMFPVLPLEVDKDIRRAYKGGFTWVKPDCKGVHFYEGIVLDVNSLYPSVMYSELLPYGYPVYFEGEPNPTEDRPLFIVKMRCQFKLKPGHIPTITLKHTRHTVVAEYIETSGTDFEEFTLTSVDLKLFFEQYDVFNEEYINGYYFRACSGVFCEYIDKWMKVKENNEGALRALAKLMVNTPYGKFATNPEGKKKIPYLDKNGVVQFNYSDNEIREPVYTAMGAFITAYARYKTITSAQKVYHRFIYADTDSLHLKGKEIPEGLEIHKSRMGAWKHEGTFFDSLYLCPKRYMESMEHEKKFDAELYAELLENKLVYDLENDGVMLKWKQVHVTCAGMPDNVKQQVTYDNFHPGHVYTGKLYKHRVPGGVVLLPGDYEFSD